MNHLVNKTSIVITIFFSSDIRFYTRVSASLFGYADKGTCICRIGYHKCRIGCSCLIDNHISACTVVPSIHIRKIRLLCCLSVVEVNNSTTSVRNKNITTFICVSGSHVRKNRKFNDWIICIIFNLFHRYFYNQLVTIQYILYGNIKDWLSGITGNIVSLAVFVTLFFSITNLSKHFFQLFCFGICDLFR